MLYPLLARAMLRRLKRRGAHDSLVVQAATPRMLAGGSAGEEGMSMVHILFGSGPFSEPVGRGASLVIAASAEAYAAAGEAANLEARLVMAPHGADVAVPRAFEEMPARRMGIVEHTVRRALRMARSAGKHDASSCFSFWTPRPPRRVYANVSWEGWPPWHADGRAAYADVDIAYCGAGLEAEALSLAAAGAIACVPNTALGQEVCAQLPGWLKTAEHSSADAIAGAMQAVLQDAIARRRRDRQHVDGLGAASWDETLYPAIEAMQQIAQSKPGRFRTQ